MLRVGKPLRQNKFHKYIHDRFNNQTQPPKLRTTPLHYNAIRTRLSSIPKTRQSNARRIFHGGHPVGVILVNIVIVSSHRIGPDVADACPGGRIVEGESFAVDVDTPGGAVGVCASVPAVGDVAHDGVAGDSVVFGPVRYAEAVNVGAFSWRWRWGWGWRGGR